MEFHSVGAGKGPEVVEPLRDLQADMGRSATFECLITGSPRPEYRWFRGMRELVDTMKYTILNKGDKQVRSLLRH